MISADCCSACGGDSRVMETRQRGEDGAIRRRRKCMRCGSRWTTAEMRVQKGQTVITAPIQAIRDLRDRVFALLRLLGVDQADADSVLELEEAASRFHGTAEAPLGTESDGSTESPDSGQEDAPMRSVENTLRVVGGSK